MCHIMFSLPLLNAEYGVFARFRRSDSRLFTTGCAPPFFSWLLLRPWWQASDSSPYSLPLGVPRASPPTPVQEQLRRCFDKGSVGNYPLLAPTPHPHPLLFSIGSLLKQPELDITQPVFLRPQRTHKNKKNRKKTHWQSWKLLCTSVHMRVRVCVCTALMQSPSAHVRNLRWFLALLQIGTIPSKTQIHTHANWLPYIHTDIATAQETCEKHAVQMETALTVHGDLCWVIKTSLKYNLTSHLLLFLLTKGYLFRDWLIHTFLVLTWELFLEGSIVFKATSWR